MYEYRCKECGSSFERLHRIDDSDRDVECPVCHGDDVERQISAFAMNGGCGTGAPSRGFR
jgi:putative FmdB family regulatory protein